MRVMPVAHRSSMPALQYTRYWAGGVPSFAMQPLPESDWIEAHPRGRGQQASVRRARLRVPCARTKRRTDVPKNDVHEVEAVDEVATLYVTLKPLLHAIAERRFCVPHDEAEALVHDLFTAYLRRRPAVLAVRSWFVAAICNACRHYWRRYARFVAPIEGEMREPTEPPAYIARITAKAILARLSVRDRYILRLRFWEGHAVRAVGMALGISESRAEKLLHRALKRAAHAADAATLASDDDPHRCTDRPRLSCKTRIRGIYRTPPKPTGVTLPCAVDVSMVFPIGRFTALPTRQSVSGTIVRRLGQGGSLRSNTRMRCQTIHRSVRTSSRVSKNPRSPSSAPTVVSSAAAISTTLAMPGLMIGARVLGAVRGRRGW